jgi:hypothetical protein
MNGSLSTVLKLDPAHLKSFFQIYKNYNLDFQIIVISASFL